MTATNHALTGAIIGIFIDKPYLALPLAFVSHFICDIIPHFKARDVEKKFKHRWFRNYLLVEAGLCFLIVLAIFLAKPLHWQQAIVCAFLATTPDFYWLRKYLAIRSNHQFKEDWFSRFALGIQWFQRPIGAVVEVAWFIAALIILIPVLAKH